jgi:hypothetical protein
MDFQNLPPKRFEPVAVEFVTGSVTAPDLFTLVSAFFVFYMARLFYVTSGLRATGAGGQGAYVGAIVFSCSHSCSAGELGVACRPSAGPKAARLRHAVTEIIKSK